MPHTIPVWPSAPNTLKTYSWKQVGRNSFSLKLKNFFPANASSEQRRNAAIGLGRAWCFAASGNKRPWLKNICFWGTSNNPQQDFHWLPVSHTGNYILLNQKQHSSCNTIALHQNNLNVIDISHEGANSIYEQSEQEQQQLVWVPTESWSQLQLHSANQSVVFHNSGNPVWNISALGPTAGHPNHTLAT